MIDIRTNALFSLGVRTIDGDGNYLMNIGIARPSEEQIQAKIEELTAAEPLRLLREKRNQLLARSDWMAVSDRTMTQAQIDYRQALRDLPATADPQLDENGNLTNVTWPIYE
jgi:hypothetical protein